MRDMREDPSPRDRQSTSGSALHREPAKTRLVDSLPVAVTAGAAPDKAAQVRDARVVENMAAQVDADTYTADPADITNANLQQARDRLAMELGFDPRLDNDALVTAIETDKNETGDRKRLKYRAVLLLDEIIDRTQSGSFDPEIHTGSSGLEGMAGHEVSPQPIAESDSVVPTAAAGLEGMADIDKVEPASMSENESDDEKYGPPGLETVETERTSLEKKANQLVVEIDEEAENLKNLQARLNELTIEMQKIRQESGFLRKIWRKVSLAETRLLSQIESITNQIKNIHQERENRREKRTAFSAQENAFFDRGDRNEDLSQPTERIIREIDNRDNVIPFQLPPLEGKWMQRFERTGRVVFVVGCIISAAVIGREGYKAMQDLHDIAHPAPSADQAN